MGLYILPRLATESMHKLLYVVRKLYSAKKWIKTHFLFATSKYHIQRHVHIKVARMLTLSFPKSVFNLKVSLGHLFYEINCIFSIK